MALWLYIGQLGLQDQMITDENQNETNGKKKKCSCQKSTHVHYDLVWEEASHTKTVTTTPYDIKHVYILATCQQILLKWQTISKKKNAPLSSKTYTNCADYLEVIFGCYVSINC